MLQQVKASAGSGKTYALTRAFLNHLRGARGGGPRSACCAAAPGYRWSEIMAVTFTNKAAAEMKERVVGALKLRALGSTDTPAADWSPREAEDKLAALLRSFSSLNIRTIDSFLNMFVRLNALELGIVPDFEPAFDLGELARPLYDALVARAEAGDPAARELLARAVDTLLRTEQLKGFRLTDSFHERLMQAFAFRLEDDHPLAADPAPLAERIVGLHAALRDAGAALARRIDDEGLAVDKRFNDFLRKCLAAEPFDAAFKESAYGARPDLDSVCNRTSKGRGSETAQAAFADFSRAYGALFAQRATLLGCYRLAPLGALAERLARDLEEHQARAGVVPNVRMAAYALRALESGSASEAFCRLGTRLAHLLVDEFQDTSREQWLSMAPLATECLSKGGSLFYVGDVKQAIYGWRGGDARLFEEVAADPEIIGPAGTLERPELPINWRSAPEVVECNNTLFGRLGDAATAAAVADAMLAKDALPAERENLARALAEAYAGAKQKVSPKADPEKLPGFVRLTDLRAETAALLDEAVGDALETLFTEELLPRRPFGHIAVLVRGNRQAALVAERLIGLGVPVITENSLLLAEHPLVRQTVALLAFLDYPYDDASLWDVLAGEELFLGAAGLTRETMTDWLARTSEPAGGPAEGPGGARGGSGRGGPLFRRLRRDFSEAWARLIGPFYSKAGLMSPYDMAREIFTRFRVFERRPEDELFARRFLEAVHAAEIAGRRSLSTFLEHWAEHGDQEKVPLPEHLDAVRVMTIHKAKGLEFPVVVTPFSNFSARPHEALTAVDTPSGRFLARQSRELGATYVRKAVQELTEQINLLYVAWTRPTEELYAFVTSTTGRGGGRTPTEKALAVLLAGEPFFLEAEDATYESGRPRDASAERPVAPARRGAPEPPGAGEAGGAGGEAAAEADATDGWKPMAWLPRLKIRRNALEREVFDRRRRGELVHGCLEGLRLTGDAAGDAERAVRFALGNAPEADRARLGGELRAILHWLMALPDFAAWRARGLPERSILDERGEVHRADLLVEEPGRTLVVEYKTGRATDEHAAQVRRYMRLLAAMPSRRGKPVAGLLVYLDERRLEPVILAPERGAAHGAPDGSGPAGENA
jgi:ATP-dependent exoDNAse (exonuclease V) beta subunit